MPFADYIAGFAFFAVILAACGAAAEIIVRRLLPGVPWSAMRVVAVSIAASAALIAAHLVPGALGILSRESVVVCAALIVLGGALWRQPVAVAPAADMPFPAPRRGSGRAEQALCVVGVLSFATWLAIAFGQRLLAEPLGFDAVSAYLPTAANWLQEGSLWQIQDWTPGFFFGSGPGNGTVFLLSTMLPWDNDFATHYAMYPFVVLTAVAIYALCRELRAPWPPAAVLGAAVAAIPVVVYPAAVNALLDPVLYLALTAGVLFLVRHRRTAGSGDLLLAGLALGIAFGTKYYGYTAVPIVLVVWAGARLLARDDHRTLARQALAVVGIVAVLGGFWAVRNAVETGNPAFPVEIGLGNATIFEAPEDPLRERLGTSLAAYLDEPGVWFGELREQFRIAVGLPLALFALGAAAALFIALRTAGRTERGLAITGVVLLLLLAASYVATPYTAPGPEGEPIFAAANVRYGIPAFLIAAGLAGFASGYLSSRLGVTFAVLGLVAVLDALRIGTTTPDSSVWLAFALALVATALWLLATRPDRSWVTSIRQLLTAPGVVGLASLTLAIALVAGHELQKDFNSSRYVGYDEMLDRFATDSEARVGLAGNWSLEEPAPIYPAFGSRLQNPVTFLGDYSEHLLTRVGTRTDFVELLHDSETEVLVVGREAPTAEDPAGVAIGNSRIPIETRWAASAGFEEVARSDRFILMVPST